jgi:hypothetical protein
MKVMTDTRVDGLNRRGFVLGTVSGAAFAALPALAGSRNPGRDAVLAQVPKMHSENIKRLQDWIALPSIAAENRNYPQGAEYMADLAQKAGFTEVRLIPTSGKPGVFGRLNAGAATTVAVYFMYDV